MQPEPPHTTRPNRSRRSARAGVVLIVSILVTASLQAAAPASTREQVRASSFERLQEARALLMTGRLTDALAAAVDLGGIEGYSGVPAVAPAGGGLATPSLRSLVAPLRQAVTIADRIVMRSTPSQLGEASRRELARAARREETLTEGVFARHGIDRQAITAAGQLLAGAIDATLPQLRSYAATHPAVPGTAECDQLEQGPVCVGGSGANSYTDDYALLIDLGGDDVHANSAGGADRGGNGLAVSVTIDLGGNDRYETPLPTKSGSRLAQGSANLGIGMLIDAAGDDTYAVSSTEPGSSARAQGYAGIGIGVLEDQGGNDAYRISYAPSRSPASRVQGQGFGSFGVAGLLLDRAGDDSYLAEATTPVTLDDQGRVDPGRPLIQGMGYGEAGGVGVAADGGGTDTMTLRGESGPVAADETREVVPAGAYAEGFGFGTLGGTGLALSGQGDTSRTISTRAEGPAVRNTSAYGFGYGSTGGFAAVLDAGGDDSYTAETRAITARLHHADDGCTCKAAGATAEGGDAGIRAGGWGGAGVGILQDLAGSDRYALFALSRTEALATDDHAAPASPAAQSYAVGGMSDIHGLGYGSVGGAGFVDDQGGNDVYDARTASQALASASASASSASPVAVVEGGEARTWAEAVGSTAGYGELRDGGGIDVYRAVAEATATPDAEDSLVADPPRSILSAQGSVEVETIQGVAHPAGGFALLIDLDAGLPDAFLATPGDPPCTGVRGQGVWRDCGPVAGIGISA